MPGYGNILDFQLGRYIASFEGKSSQKQHLLFGAAGLYGSNGSAKDPNLRLDTLAPSPEDKSHTPSHGFGSHRELPAMCWGGDEDCSHLFFTCPIVQEAWRAAGVARLVASSDKAFWSSLIDGSF